MKGNDVECLKVLLEHGAELVKDPDVLLRAIRYGPHVVPMLELLVEQGVGLAFEGRPGTVWHALVEAGALDVLSAASFYGQEWRAKHQHAERRQGNTAYGSCQEFQLRHGAKTDDHLK